jgi:hypothetical protein
MSALEDALKPLIERIVEARLASLPRPKAESADAKTLEVIRQLQIISSKPYLNKQELMLYLDVSDRSIEEWSQRPPDKNPLPVVRAGRDLRIKRERADEWMEREGERYWRLRNLKEAS